jgi:transposase
LFWWWSSGVRAEPVGQVSTMITSPSVRRGSRELCRSDIDRLVDENGRLRAEVVALRADVDRAQAEATAREAEVERLKTENAGLRAKLEEARRAGKRQSAPFSRDRRKPDEQRKRPGRKAGEAYGKKARRLPPEDTDEDIPVPLPDSCPHCGEDLLIDPERWVEQFQDELVTAIVRRKFVMALGRCPGCERAVRGRHPAQTSDAVGAAGAMLGPQALALGAWLHYGCGLSAAKISQLYGCLGLGVSPGGVTSALERVAADACGTYEALKAALRVSEVVSPDETGWRVDAERGWLWVFVGDKVTVYDIAVGEGARSYGVARNVLGEEFSGILCRDGWASYRCFKKATHQTCLAHLLRRANEMVVDSVGGQARIPHAVRRLLLDALALRARRDTAQIGGPELHDEIAKLEARADKLISAKVTHEPNRRLLAHLGTERDALFTFLKIDAVPATNHQAERGIRPQVCIRKNWGGNKTMQGAYAAKVIGSVIRTATQQGLDPTDVLVEILTSDGTRNGLDLHIPEPGP